MNIEPSLRGPEVSGFFYTSSTVPVAIRRYGTKLVGMTTSEIPKSVGRNATNQYGMNSEFRAHNPKVAGSNPAPATN